MKARLYGRSVRSVVVREKGRRRLYYSQREMVEAQIGEESEKRHFDVRGQWHAWFRDGMEILGNREECTRYWSSKIVCTRLRVL